MGERVRVVYVHVCVAYACTVCRVRGTYVYRVPVEFEHYLSFPCNQATSKLNHKPLLSLFEYCLKMTKI